jgi:hypothetical protein
MKVNQSLTIELLSLGETQTVLLDSLRNGYGISWASAGLRGRLRNLGLITAAGDAGWRLTSLGNDVTILRARHSLRTRSRALGRGALRGSGMRYGVDASCSCHGWSWKTNESGPSARKCATRAHVQHMLDIHSEGV